MGHTPCAQAFERMGVISSSAKAVRKPHEGAIDVEITILTVKLRLEIGDEARDTDSGGWYAYLVSAKIGHRALDAARWR